MGKNFLKSHKYILLLSGIALCLAVKSFFGFGWDDEGYYLSVAHRFFMGEVPLYEEWFPASLSGCLLYPIYALYRWIMGSGEGSILFFRLFFLLLLFLNSLFVYRIIRKYTQKEKVAFFAAAFLLVYSKQNVALYSYNDMAVAGLILSTILLFYEETARKKKRSVYAMAGVCFVLTVFCNPYCFLLWIYFVFLAFLLWRKEKDQNRLIYLGYFTLGCCLLGVPFLILVFTNSSWNGLVTSLYYVIHGFGFIQESIWVKLLKGCWYSGKAYSLPGIMLQIVFFSYAVMQAAQKKLTVRKKDILMSAQILCTLWYLLGQFLLLEDQNVIGIAYIPLSVLALMCFILTEKKDWLPVLLFYVPGILMSAAFQCSSGTGIYAITTGFTVAAVGATLMAAAYLRENGNRAWAVWSVLILVLMNTFLMRMSYTRFAVWEEHYDCRIESGPYRGIITDTDQKKFYEQTMAEIDMLNREGEEDHVFLVGKNTWMYLCTDRKAGTPTTWRMHPQNPLLENYFEIHPDKTPEWIYVDGTWEQAYGETILLNGKTYTRIYSGVGNMYRKTD